MDVLDKIKNCGVIPVVVLEDAGKAEALAGAILDGGLNCVEITFRAKAASGAIKAIKKKYPEMVLGAGTVLSTEQAEQAMEAGAEFIVSPGSNPEVIHCCMEQNVCIIPGVMTPSEIETNLQMGITTMKFFPAEAAGGIKMIKAMSAPYGGVQFMPTGGIHTGNIKDYLKSDRVTACGGSWMVKEELLRAERYDEITRLCKEAADIVKEVR